MHLEDVTQVLIGVVLSRKEAKYPTANTFKYKVFNLKSYEEQVEYDTFYSKENLDSFIAKKGDILFRLSFPMKVIEVDDDIDGKLINNQYCIIRMISLFNVTYNKDFIKWFLESELAMHQLERVLIGSTIKSVPVAKLRLLEIPNLNSTEQEQISKIVNTWYKQKSLYEELLKEKDKYYDYMIKKIISGGNN